MREFFYIVTDDSMSGDRILFGDVVRIQETQNIAPGDIIAFSSDDDISRLTLKRTGSDECTYTGDNKIIGKVVGIIVNR